MYCDAAKYHNSDRVSMTRSCVSAYQVYSDGGPQQPAAVDVYRMVSELDDPGETRQDGQHDEGEHQQRLKQLG